MTKKSSVADRSDSSSGIASWFGRFGFALMLALTGLFFTVFAFQSTQVRATSPGDPGPAFVPATLGVLLIIGSLFHAFGGRNELASDSSEENSTADSSSDTGVIALLAGILVYLPMLHWIGFSVSSAVAVVGLLIGLRTRPWVAICVSIGLVAFAKALFTFAFDVQLPEGILASWLEF